MRTVSMKMSARYDVQALVHDLEICLQKEWKHHYNTNDYTGDWTAVGLRSLGGESGNVISQPGGIYADTPLLSECVYFTKILSDLPFQKETVRLLNLAPGSVVKEHTDPGLSYAHGEFRMHIPIITSAAVEFIVAGERLDMGAGELWYADFSMPHSVRNTGATSRIHLVIDGLRNAWTDEWFASAGYDFDAEKKFLRPSRESVLAQIAELKRMGGATAEALVLELEAGLKRNEEESRKRPS